MRWYCFVPLTLLLVNLACRPADLLERQTPVITTSAKLMATLPAGGTGRATPQDVKKVTIQIFWDGGSTPLLEMTKTGSTSYELVAGELPANIECTVLAKALGEADAILYEAQADGTAFAPDVQTNLVLNMVARGNGDHEGAAPRIIAVRRPATIVQTGNIVDLEFTVGDSDDTRLSYVLSATGGAFSASDGTVDLTGGTASWPVQYTAPATSGPASITLVVTDSAGLAVSFSFTLMVQEDPFDADPTEIRATINFPPVIERVTASRTGDGPINLLATTVDDGPASALTFRWSRGGQLIGETNPVALVADGDTFTISLTITDGYGASTSMSYDLNTTGTSIWHLPITNSAPEVVSAVKSRDDVSYGDTVDLALYANDLDGDVLTAEWSTDSGTVDSASGEVAGGVTVFKATWHAAETAGLAHVTVTVHDPRQAWVAYVFPINQVLGRVKITANAGPDSSALVGGSVTLTGSGSASDDGQILSYEWVQVGGPTSTIESPNQVATVVRPSTAGTYRYRLTVRNINNSATDEVLVVATDPLAFMFDDAFMADDGIIYFLNKTDWRIHRYDLKNWEWKPPFETGIDLRTMAVAPEGNQVYVGYLGGRVEVIDTATGQRTFFANVATTVSNMAVADGYVFTIDSSGSWGTFSLYSRANGQRTASATWHDYSAGIAYSRTLRRIFTFRDGTSPNDIIRTDVTEAGTFGTSTDSPYHGDYSFTHPMRLFPDETRIAVASGVIFSTSTLTYAGSLGTSYLDMTFYGNMPLVVKKIGTNTELTIRNQDLSIQEVRSYAGEPMRIFRHGDNIVLIIKRGARLVGLQAVLPPA